MSRTVKSLCIAFAVVVSTIVTTAFAVVMSSSPVSAEGPLYTYPNNDGVSQIYNFGEHTCGVQDDVLWCWGSNDNYRIGRYRFIDTGNSGSDQYARPVPRIIKGGMGDGNMQLCPRPAGGGPCTSPTTDFELSATKGIVGMGGLYNTCVIQGSSPSAVTGKVYCMGWNNNYQSGVATTADVKVPTAVGTGNGFTNTNVIAVDGGVDFSCAIEGTSSASTDGAVYCWGNDAKGQLGNGVSSSSNQVPVQANASGGFLNTGVSSLSVGFQHACAVEGGTAYCWGNNGDVVGGANDVMWPPQLVSGCAPKWFNGCGVYLITTGGTGRAGQPAATTSITSPTAVQNGTDGFTNTGVTQVSAGYRHSCAIQSGSVYCWGNNQSGQLGDGTTDASATPKKVVAGGGFTNTAVTQIVAGDYFTCALEGGSVYCWGDQQLGRLGNLNYVPKTSVATPFMPQSTPVKVADGAIEGGNTNVDKLATGSGAHSCVLKAGKAYCWGPGRKWATLADGTSGTIVYCCLGPDFSEDAPQPRMVQWGAPNEPSPYDPVYPPGVPTNVVAKAGWNKVTVTFTPPTYTGSYPITNYLVTSTPGNKACISTLADVSLTSCTFTSLTPGVKYTFVAQGLNGGGWGDRSAASNSAAPTNLKITSYNRKALGLLRGQASDVMVGGVAPGYATGTKVVPWVQIADGTWVSYPESKLSVNAQGKFEWNRRFVKNLNPKAIKVKFEIGGNFSNTVIIGSVKTSNSILSIESTGADFGGMPNTGNPQTDIQFGFESGAELVNGLPMQFDGSNLKPGTTVTATYQRTTPTGTLTTLWGPPAAKSISPAVQEVVGTVGTAITDTAAFTATGFTPTTFTASGLPAGLSINAATGVISGNPSAASTAQATVTASAGADSATAKVGFNIAASSATSLAPATLTVNGVVGELIAPTSAFTPTGLVGDVTYATSGLPDGLYLDATTGVISGAAMVPSTSHLVITATGATSGTAKATVNLNIVYTSASATVDENGDVYTVLNLPNDMPAGIYDIVFTGTAPDGSTVSETNTIEVSQGQPATMFSEFTGVTIESNYIFYAIDETPKPLGPDVRPVTAVSPSRLIDTRDTAIVNEGGVLEVQVTGRGGVPTGATTAILNVTATDHVGDAGYLTVYACESTRRETSSLNIEDGGTVANAVTIELGASGKVCIYSRNKTHIVVDVTGYAAADSTLWYSSMTPARLVDTRQTDSATKRLSAGQTLELAMPSDVPEYASAVALNVTLDRIGAWGWATVYPCGQERPNASTVNALAGRTAAGSALALLGSGDKVCIYTSAETDLIVDVFGWYSELAPAALQSHEATRVLDTRRQVEIAEVVEDGTTIEVADDDVFVVRSLIPAGSTSAVSTDLGYRGEASAVVANLTVTMPEAQGYLTVFDCATEMPIVSSLNFVAGETRANQIVIPTTTDSICVYNSVGAHIIVDVVGRYLSGQYYVV